MAKIYYELNEDNPNEVFKVEELYDEPREDGYFPFIRSFYGMVNKICTMDCETETVYYHGIINLHDGTYLKDPDNHGPIIVNGVEYPLDENGEVVLPKFPPMPQITNEDLAQQVSDLEARLVIAGVI
jgi:hypothetical protein